MSDSLRQKSLNLGNAKSLSICTTADVFIFLWNCYYCLRLNNLTLILIKSAVINTAYDSRKRKLQNRVAISTLYGFAQSRIIKNIEDLVLIGKTEICYQICRFFKFSRN